jgi:hypothetical protein
LPHLLAFIVLLLAHPHAFVVLLLAILVPILLPVLQSLIISLPAHANLLLGRLISLRAFRWRLSTFYPRSETGTRAGRGPGVCTILDTNFREVIF